MQLLDWLRAYLPQRRRGPLEITIVYEGRTSTPFREGADDERVYDELHSLVERHDLDRWRFTSRIRIDESAPVPRSHPVLTLNTRYYGGFLLAVYLHEQLHWFVWRHRGTRRALADLRKRYPDVPIEPPLGAGSAFSSYLHYLVCYLEYAALIELLGPKAAGLIVRYWSVHHYTEIYKTVLRDFDAIGEIVARHGLIP